MMTTALDQVVADPFGPLAAPELERWYESTAAPRQDHIDRLLQLVEAHVAEEAESVAAYRGLAERTSDPMVSFLMRLVVEDEDRHHRLLERMAATLISGLAWRDSPDALPGPGVPTDEASPEAIAATRRFIGNELADCRSLRRMAREERRVHDGLFSLLLETMAMDSQKHERILRFILRRLEARTEGR